MKAHPWRSCSQSCTNARGNDLVPPRRTFPWPTSNGSAHCCAENGFRKVPPLLPPPHPLHQLLPWYTSYNNDAREKNVVGNQERDHHLYVHGEENEHATGVLPDYRQGPPEPELGRLVRWIDHHSVAQWDHRHLWPASRSGRVAWLAQESA